MNDTRAIPYYEFLDRIRAAPQAYLDDATLSALEECMYEALSGRGAERLLPAQPHEPNIGLLGEWISIRSGIIGKSDSGCWDRLSADFFTITRMTAKNDSEAFTAFFEFLNEFRKRTPILAAEVTLTAEQIAALRDSHGPYRPIALKARRLSPDPDCYLYKVVPAADEDGFTERLCDVFCSLKSLLTEAATLYGVKAREWTIHDPEAVKSGLAKYLNSWLPWKKPKLL